MSYTIPDIISWGKISQPLAALDEAKKRAFKGGSTIKDLHIKLYVERKSVEWEYDQDPTSDNLFEIGNWLYALEGIYGLQAQFIGGGSGGDVTPINPPSLELPDPLDWVIDTLTSAEAPLADGDSTVALDGSGGMPNFKGWNIEFTRGGSTQNTTNTGASYYTWDRATGVFSCSPAAVLGELFRILPTR